MILLSSSSAENCICFHINYLLLELHPVVIKCGHTTSLLVLASLLAVVQDG